MVERKYDFGILSFEKLLSQLAFEAPRWLDKVSDTSINLVSNQVTMILWTTVKRQTLLHYDQTWFHCFGPAT